MSEPIPTMSLHNQYDKLSEINKRRFSEIAVKLLDRMVLLEVRENDKNDYYFVREHLTLFQNYFGLIQYEVNFYEMSRLIMLESRLPRTLYSFKKNETVVLLCLRLLHLEKLKKEVSSSSRVFITLEELHILIEKTGIFTKRIVKTELGSILVTLKRFSIINYEVLAVDNDQMVIEIYNTLTQILPSSDIETLLNRIKGMVKEDVVNEEVDED